MPSVLRSRLALLGLLGAFLIPIGMSSLRGLTHVLTCKEERATPFSLTRDRGGEVVVTTSRRLVRGEEEAGACPGLSFEMGARFAGRDAIEMVLPIENTTTFLWRGTVELVVDGVAIPVGIGEIGPGETRRESVRLSLERGVQEVSGSLLIGP
ncbi:MAG: hypothetical protein ABR575_11920 [Actinomycetota bacterium]